MKRNRLFFNRVLPFLLVIILIGSTFIPFISSVHAEKLVSSINLAISGKVVEHAFGDRKYGEKYYKNITLQVTALFSDGTSTNVTKNSTFISTDNSVVVSPDGIVTGQADTEGYVMVTYQNKQAAIKVNSNWDYVSGSYALNLLSQPTYGELTKSKVVFKDPNLEIIVREHLNKPIGTITEEDMKQLRSLDADYRNIKDLNGLQFAIDLEELNVEGNQIKDLNPLQSLPNLKKLWLGDNQVTDLKPLSDLTALTELYAWKNQLVDLKGLENLTNLSTLDVHHNELSNINFSRKLTKLSTLNLNNNDFKSINPLSELTSLVSVGLSQNQIKDIKVLDDLSQLHWVDLIGNPLSTMALSSLQQLKTNGVYVDYEEYDTTPVKFADPNLERAISKYLEISTPIKKGDLRDIQFLDLSNQGIMNLKGLENATDLQSINISSNLITNMDVFLHLSQINWVDISRNPIVSESQDIIQTLENREVYVSYDLNYDSTPVEFADSNLENALDSDLTKPITKGDLSKFEYLFLISESISSLKGLEHAKNLIGLSIARNNLTNINELQNLDKLQNVDITRNPVDISEGSEASAIIKGLEEKGATIHYDVNFDVTPIEFADPNLEYALQGILDVPSRITKGEISHIESLQINNQQSNNPSRAIIRLDGMEHATNLKTLFLDGNQIADLSPLASLKQLSELHLRNNDISDLTPLLGLTNLHYLDIRNNLFDASPDSPARTIITSLQERGVTVDFDLGSDTIVKGIVVDEIGTLSKYSYITVIGNNRTYQTSWDSSGEFDLKLGDGSYSVTGITIKSINQETFPINQSFEIREGKLYVNGEIKENLEVKLLPVTLKGSVVDENGLPLANANVSFDGSNRGSGLANEQGNFSIRLGDGTYRIYNVSIGNEQVSLNIPFEIREGKLYVNDEIRENLEVKLPPATLKGSLVDENGLPVANANVQVEGNNRWFGTQTDSQGKFGFRLEDGTYNLNNISFGNEAAPQNLVFEIKEGKLYLNGELKENLEIKLPSVTKGSVVDENGSPVANAYVSVNGNNRWFGTQTDSQGKFSFRLEDGTYNLNNISFGNEAAPQNLVFEIREGKLYVNGELKEQLEIKLLPVTMTGKLVDENGQSLANTYIQVDRNNQGYGIHTDSQGNFSFRLGDGMYIVSYVSIKNEGISLNIPFEIRGGKIYVNGELKENLEVKLPPATLKGSLVDENELPVANAYVSGHDNNNRWFGTQTDSQGKFSFRLEDGTYNLNNISFGNVAAPQNLVFEIREGKLYVNGVLKEQLEIKLLPVTMTGKLVDEKGQSLANTYIQVDRNNQGYSIHTDSQGKFSFRLGDGTYIVSYVSIKNEGISLNIPFEIRGGKIYVNGELKENLEVKLPPVTLKGSVVDENGLPVANAYVSGHGNNRWFGTQTDSQGKFSFRLEDGTYNLNNISFGNGAAPQNLVFEIREGKLYVNGELKENLEVKLPPVTLKGSVVDENGLPVANAYVSGHGNNRGFGTQTDSQGNFSFRLGDGMYIVSYVSIKNEGISLNIPFEIRGGKIYVNGELKENLEVKLPPVTLKGSVVDENGLPVANAYVSGHGNNRWFGTQTDSQGKFSFRLEDGTYNLNNISFGNEALPQNLVFEIKEGKLYLNGELKEKLEVKILPITLKGNVIDENGLPVVNANVLVEGNNRVFEILTDSQGKFSFRLEDGTYNLNNFSFKNETAPQNLKFEIKEGKLYVNGELNEQLEIKLPPITLRGNVVDENGSSLAHADVFVEVNNKGIGSRTDERGTFTHRLIDGVYRISYIRKGNEGIQQNIPFEIREGKLYVNGELKEQLEIKLIPVTLKGTVVDENGLPVTNAYVTFHSNNRGFGTHTDSQGKFSFRLEDGTYNLNNISFGNEAAPQNLVFEIKEGKLYVNGELKEGLEIKLLPEQ